MTHLQNVQEIKKGCGKKWTHINGYSICGDNELCETCKSKLSGYLLAVKKMVEILERLDKDEYTSMHTSVLIEEIIASINLDIQNDLNQLVLKLNAEKKDDN